MCVDLYKTIVRLEKNYSPWQRPSALKTNLIENNFFEKQFFSSVKSNHFNLQGKHH